MSQYLPFPEPRAWSSSMNPKPFPLSLFRLSCTTVRTLSAVDARARDLELLRVICRFRTSAGFCFCLFLLSLDERQGIYIYRKTARDMLLSQAIMKTVTVTAGLFAFAGILHRSSAIFVTSQALTRHGYHAILSTSSAFLMMCTRPPQCSC